MDKNLKLDLQLQIKEGVGVLVNKKIVDQTDDIKEYSSLVMVLPPGIEDVAVNLGGVAKAKTIFIQTNYPVTIKLNSASNTGFLVRRNFMIDGEVTAIYVSNDSGVQEVYFELIAVE